MTLSTPIKDPECTSVKIVVIYLKKEGYDLLRNQSSNRVKLVQVSAYGKEICTMKVEIP